MEAVLNQGGAARTVRRGCISKPVAPLHCEKNVVQGPKVEVDGLWWQERAGQPLPGKVPREERELLLNPGRRLVYHPVPVDVGGLGGLQEGHIDTR